MAMQNAQKEMILESPQLQIQNNLVSLPDSFIQISSITRVWLGSIPGPSFPWALGVGPALAGLFCLLQDASQIKSIGFLLLIFGGYMIWRYMSASPVYGLNIEMNSGQTYTFTSSNLSFLKKAYEVMLVIIRDRLSFNETYLINMADGIIVNGAGNTVSMGGEN